MTKRIRLGILTPSSNTSLEPLSQAIIAQLPNVSVHFSRFTVLKISLPPTISKRGNLNSRQATGGRQRRHHWLEWHFIWVARLSCRRRAVRNYYRSDGDPRYDIRAGLE